MADLVLCPEEEEVNAPREEENRAGALSSETGLCAIGTWTWSLWRYVLCMGTSDLTAEYIRCGTHLEGAQVAVPGKSLE